MSITQFRESTPNELAEMLAGHTQRLIRQELEAFKKDLQPEQPTEYVTRLEVAKLLGVSTVTIDSWTKKGRLTAYRIGNRIRYNRKEVEQSLIKI